MTICLLMISIGAVAISGVPGLLLSRRSALGQRIAATMSVAGSLLGGAALVLHYIKPEDSHPVKLPWALPLGGFAIAIDDISLIFLIPILLVSALGSIYGLTYWAQRQHIANGRKLRLCWGLLAAAMAMVALSRNGVLFLMSWEVMALSAYFLIATEDTRAEPRNAAWIYLVATHVGTLCLFGFFALLRLATGSFELWPTALTNLPPHMATALFVLGLVGFGLKAGLMPLHVWLPGAHANAPSHVSAILSGVMLKAGIYGLLRLTALMPNPPAGWGVTLLVAGACSAVLGISFAVGQRDIKKLLAYSSIENVGIIVMGLGLAGLGRSLGRGDWIILGLGGALLHVLNHSLFKPLLFMGAGSILHAAGTREMDPLGGLAKAMPRTFLLFLIGAIAICGLPPLNGFVGEFFLYLGLFKTATAAPAMWSWAALAAPALALVGALAVAGFVKVLGAVFLGAPRSALAAHAHDPGLMMLAPMWVLAGCCVIIGVMPGVTLGVLDRAIAGWTPQSWERPVSLSSQAPVTCLTAAAIALFAAVVLGSLWFRRRPAVRTARSAGTWDCGYARPAGRMEYTGSSFTRMLVELLAWVIWPKGKSPRIGGVFAGESHFSSEVPDVVLDRALLPAFGSAEWLLGWARVFQRGPIQVYMLYVLGILIALLLLS